MLFCSVAGVRSSIKLFPSDIKGLTFGGPEAVMTDSKQTHTHTHTLSLVCFVRQNTSHTHFHSRLCFFFSPRSDGLTGVPTVLSQHTERTYPYMGKEQPSLYGEASSVVTALSAGSSLAFLLLQVSLGVFHFRFAGWRRSRAAFHKSLALVCDPLFSEKEKEKEKKKIHKPPSSPFPAILHSGVWCSKISLARDGAHLAFLSSS